MNNCILGNVAVSTIILKLYLKKSWVFASCLGSCHVTFDPSILFKTGDRPSCNDMVFRLNLNFEF